MSLRYLPVILLLLAVPAYAGEHADDWVAPSVMADRLRGDDAPLLVDVRTLPEYNTGHIAGAVLLPHEQVAARLHELGEARQVVLYCRRGRRARIAGAVLADNGFTVSYLQGDYPGWVAAGLPIVAPNPDEEGPAS